MVFTMNGLIRNTASLFSNNGKLFVMAMDRGQAGVVPGLEDVAAKMYGTAHSELDGYLVNLGPARRMADDQLVNKKLLLRTSFGGSAFCGDNPDGHFNFISPENVLALGADAVLIGRPVCHAAIGGGAEGVELYFNKIKGELYDNMLITGCNTLDQITADKIRNRNSY